jgi:hypothetical protein
MCGRTRLTADSEAVAAAFDLAEVPNLEQLWNIALSGGEPIPAPFAGATKPISFRYA